MGIDTEKIDRKIALLQKLKELASDPEARNLLLEFVTNSGSNGHVSPSKTRKPDASYGRGDLTEAVEKACLTFTGRFTSRLIRQKLKEIGFVFAAKDPDVALYSVLRRLEDKELIERVAVGKPGKPSEYIVKEELRKLLAP